MSVYNGENHVAETIDSVLNQTFNKFEFIIIDDGSTDRTADILQSYEDPRIRLFTFKRNRGIPEALNHGIKHAVGKFIVKVDGDDIQHPERFEKQLKFMIQNPQFVLTKTLVNYFPDSKKVENSTRYMTIKKYVEPYKNKVKTPKHIAKTLDWYCCIPHTTMMIKKEILSKYQYNKLPLSEDYDLFYRMNQDDLLMGHIDECLVNTRISAVSTTVQRNNLFDQCAYKIKEKNMELFKKNQYVYIWGAGSYGQSVLELLLEKNWTIQGFIDSDVRKKGIIVKGHRIYSKDIIDNSKKNKIIIASQPGMFDIIRYLSAHGYKSEQDFMVLR